MSSCISKKRGGSRGASRGAGGREQGSREGVPYQDCPPVSRYEQFHNVSVRNREGVGERAGEQEAGSRRHGAGREYLTRIVH